MTLLYFKAEVLAAPSDIMQHSDAASHAGSGQVIVKSSSDRRHYLIQTKFSCFYISQKSFIKA
jgi:hypothetical protein